MDGPFCSPEECDERDEEGETMTHQPRQIFEIPARPVAVTQSR